jgi:hypothetical protein
MEANGNSPAASKSARLGPRSLIESARMTESPLVKRLIWSGLLAGTGALASIVASRVATMIWMRLFDEDPPE